jgi:hypothetical protein
MGHRGYSGSGWVAAGLPESQRGLVRVFQARERGATDAERFPELIANLPALQVEAGDKASREIVAWFEETLAPR